MATLHNRRESLTQSFFDRSVLEVAPELIGATLLVGGIGGVIVEVEAYHHTEPAAHSYRGRTAAERRDVRTGGVRLRLPVLRNSLVPQLRMRRGRQRQRRAAACAAADRRGWRRCGGGAASPTSGCCAPDRGAYARRSRVTDAHNGRRLDRPPFALFARPGAVEVATGPRIGLTKAVELPWRYGLAGSSFLSKPFKAARGS